MTRRDPFTKNEPHRKRYDPLPVPLNVVGFPLRAPISELAGGANLAPVITVSSTLLVAEGVIELGVRHLVSKKLGDGVVQNLSVLGSGLGESLLIRLVSHVELEIGAIETKLLWLFTAHTSTVR